MISSFYSLDKRQIFWCFLIWKDKQISGTVLDCSLAKTKLRVLEEVHDEARVLVQSLYHRLGTGGRDGLWSDYRAGFDWSLLLRWEERLLQFLHRTGWQEILQTCHHVGHHTAAIGLQAGAKILQILVELVKCSFHGLHHRIKLSAVRDEGTFFWEGLSQPLDVVTPAEEEDSGQEHGGVTQEPGRGDGGAVGPDDGSPV